MLSRSPSRVRAFVLFERKDFDFSSRQLAQRTDVILFPVIRRHPVEFQLPSVLDTRCSFRLYRPPGVERGRNSPGDNLLSSDISTDSRLAEQEKQQEGGRPENEGTRVAATGVNR